MQILEERITRGPGTDAIQGTCYLCKMAESVTFVDTGVADEYYPGTVKVCANCIGQLAQAIGYFSPQAREGWIVKVRERDDIIGRLKPKAEAYERVKNAIKDEIDLTEEDEWT